MSLKKLSEQIELYNSLYSNYNESNDKGNWNMDSINFLIYFESKLEALSYKRIYDSELNDLVMSLIGFIKFNGLETNSEIKF